ncbi:MAG: helix-turn-helix domain-containing protein [Fimbriimonadales bacterium]
MKRASSTQHPALDVFGRPGGGLGEPGPSGSPNSASKARLDLFATLHRLIDTLADGPGFDASAQGDSVHPNHPLLLDATEAAKLLSLSRAKVCQMANHGEIPSVRVGRAVRIPRDQLIAWVNDRTAEPQWLRARRLPAWSRNERSLER